MSLSLPQCAFSEECLARGWTVTELPNPVSRGVEFDRPLVDD